MHTQPADTTASLPYLTAGTPGIGGRIKSRPDDFLVEETPLYEPCGTGTHLYLRIEKREMTTHEAARRLTQALGRPARDVGFAGLKDANAVTRQTLSIEHVDPDRIAGLDIPGLTILECSRHTNKLKKGHLRANRFTIKLRDVAPTPLGPAEAVLQVLTRRGVPNYFGPQRFGNRGDNWQIGLAVLKNDLPEALAVLLGRPGPADTGRVLDARRHFDLGRLEEAIEAWPPNSRMHRHVLKTLLKSGSNARKAWRAVDRDMRSFYLSAAQSYLFNRVLAERIDALDRVRLGDLAYKHVNGACFRVDDPDAEQPRCDAFEISPTGPLFGRRMTQPAGAPGQLENRILTEAGLSHEALKQHADARTEGARRPLRVPITDPAVTEGRDDAGPFLRLSFSLPAGSYATAVLREISKHPAPSPPLRNHPPLPETRRPPDETPRS